MSAAIIALVCAGLETELALRGQRLSSEAQRRRHGGWAFICFAVGMFCALNHWITR